MDELTEKDREDVRAFIENTDGSYPDLSDLPAFWDAVGPDAPATVRTGGIFPGVTQREIMLLRYLVYARVKLWAWDGLDRLHKGPDGAWRVDPRTPARAHQQGSPRTPKATEKSESQSTLCTAR